MMILRDGGKSLTGQPEKWFPQTDWIYDEENGDVILLKPVKLSMIIP
ncbi:MAG: hypothetical protein ACLSHW_03595 [Lachnospiraceae bacterium]